VNHPQDVHGEGVFGIYRALGHEEGDHVELTLRIPADEVLNVETLMKLKSAGVIDDDVIRFVPKPGLFGPAAHYEIVLEGDEVEYVLELLADASHSNGEDSLRVWRLKRQDQLTLGLFGVGP